jgi:hypothetical protein
VKRQRLEIVNKCRAHVGHNLFRQEKSLSRPCRRRYRDVPAQILVDRIELGLRLSRVIRL